MIIEQLKTLVEMQKLDDQIGRYRILQLYSGILEGIHHLARLGGNAAEPL